MTEPTIFEKIITGDIPSTKIYEDKDLFAFFDIAPVAKGHTLLVTKQPIPWVQDVPDELISKAFIKSKDIITAMKTGLGCDYVQISIVGTDVPHFHIHLIPRYFDDGLPKSPTTTYTSDEERDELAIKISRALS